MVQKSRSESSKAIWDARERKKAAKARREAALFLAQDLHDAGHEEAAIMCLQYANITAHANGLSQ